MNVAETDRPRRTSVADTGSVRDSVAEPMSAVASALNPTSRIRDLRLS